MAIRIGTSGWHYPHWADGIFYPRACPDSNWLGFYARRFDAVEINSTFYRLPSAKTVEAWKNATSPHFRFTAKASRFLTHMKKPARPEVSLEVFLRRISLLGEKLSAVLFQLPPFLPFDAPRLETLAACVAGQRIVPGLRAAIEFRNPSWFVPRALEILRHHGIALVHSDPPGLKIPRTCTAPFSYLRRHGSRRSAGPGYTRHELATVARWIRQLDHEGRDVFCFFNNDTCAAAPRDALALQKILNRKTNKFSDSVAQESDPSGSGNPLRESASRT